MTPKLFGAEGFELIRKVLNIWNDLGGTVNRTCGTHVHIDAWNWDVPHMLELARIWAKIEQKVLWYLVSPSRRGNG
ncbi:MAG: amidoligase family protein, partial [Nitrospirae bacterium]|nr:amidoligase family protein [Nitrospirota bacterium]